MASTMNPFDLLVDKDTDDLTELVKASVVLEKKVSSKQTAVAAAAPVQAVKPAAKLPSKPLPPSQAVREARSDVGRGGGRGGRGRGRDHGERESSFNGYSGGGGYNKPSDERDSGKAAERRGGYGGARGSFRGGRGGGFADGDGAEGERPRRVFERRSGTGRGNDFKREGAGRGNWGTPTDDTVLVKEETQPEKEKNVDEGKQSGEQEVEVVSKEKPDDEPQEKEPEPEEKEMTLEEYEKVLEEKRKALLLNKPEERKVNVDKELQSMKQIANKKANDEFFAKLGAEKEKRKESAEKEEKAKKAVSITEFLKPAEGERSSYRGRGRGRGPRGGFNSNSQSTRPTTLASIEDPGHFPALGAK